MASRSSGLGASKTGDNLPTVYLLPKALPPDIAAEPVYKIGKLLCDSMSHIIDKNKVVGSQLYNGAWRLYSSDYASKTSLLTNGLEINGYSLQLLGRCPFLVDGEETVKLIIRNIPIDTKLCSDDDIKQALQGLGVRIGSEIYNEYYREPDKKLTTFKSGGRFLYILLPPTPLPRSVKIGKHIKAWLILPKEPLSLMPSDQFSNESGAKEFSSSLPPDTNSNESGATKRSFGLRPSSSLNPSDSDAFTNDFPSGSGQSNCLPKTWPPLRPSDSSGQASANNHNSQKGENVNNATSTISDSALPNHSLSLNNSKTNETNQPLSKAKSRPRGFGRGKFIEQNVLPVDQTNTDLIANEKLLFQKMSKNYNLISHSPKPSVSIRGRGRGGVVGKSKKTQTPAQIISGNIAEQHVGEINQHTTPSQPDPHQFDDCELNSELIQSNLVGMSDGFSLNHNSSHQSGVDYSISSDGSHHAFNLGRSSHTPLVGISDGNNIGLKSVSKPFDWFDNFGDLDSNTLTYSQSQSSASETKSTKTDKITAEFDPLLGHKEDNPSSTPHISSKKSLTATSSLFDSTIIHHINGSHGDNNLMHDSHKAPSVLGDTRMKLVSPIPPNQAEGKESPPGHYIPLNSSSPFSDVGFISNDKTFTKGTPLPPNGNRNDLSPEVLPPQLSKHESASCDALPVMDTFELDTINLKTNPSHPGSLSSDQTSTCALATSIKETAGENTETKTPSKVLSSNYDIMNKTHIVSPCFDKPNTIQDKESIPCMVNPPCSNMENSLIASQNPILATLVSSLPSSLSPSVSSNKKKTCPKKKGKKQATLSEILSAKEKHVSSKTNSISKRKSAIRETTKNKKSKGQNKIKKLFLASDDIQKAKPLIQKIKPLSVPHRDNSDALESGKG